MEKYKNPPFFPRKKDVSVPGQMDKSQNKRRQRELGGKRERESSVISV